MFVHVDPTHDLAIYDQIVRQIKFAVANGAVGVGDLVPSVRELARELAINPNTVARTYLQLQTENVLETVRGLGLAVAAGADKRCRQERGKLIQARLQQVLGEARQSGLEPDEIRKLVEAELSRLQRGRPWNP
jgi:GntR family transcriptional regulator